MSISNTIWPVYPWSLSNWPNLKWSLKTGQWHTTQPQNSHIKTTCCEFYWTVSAGIFVQVYQHYQKSPLAALKIVASASFFVTPVNAPMLHINSNNLYDTSPQCHSITYANNWLTASFGVQTSPKQQFNKKEP